MVPIEAMLGYVLLLVGFVFFCNGMTVLGKTGAKEVGVLNFAVGVLILMAASHVGIVSGYSPSFRICPYLFHGSGNIYPWI